MELLVQRGNIKQTGDSLLFTRAYHVESQGNLVLHFSGSRAESQTNLRVPQHQKLTCFCWTGSSLQRILMHKNNNINLEIGVLSERYNYLPINLKQYF